jgi:hypothetical protein
MGREQPSRDQVLQVAAQAEELPAFINPSYSVSTLFSQRRHVGRSFQAANSTSLGSTRCN